MISVDTVNKKAALRPANLFFVELIIVLLFFSFSTAVILQVFAAADERQKVSNITERAIICAQSMAEAYSVTGDIGEAIALTFGEEHRSAVADGELLLDSGFRPSDDGIVEFTFYEMGQTSDAGRLSQLKMSFNLVGEKELYASSCYAYISNGGAEDG